MKKEPGLKATQETQNPADEANARVAAAAAEKKRKQRPFPACSFEEALEFASAIYAFGSGQPVRRISLFDHLNKSPESGASRQLIINAGKYELTEGGVQADLIRLTDDGIRAVNEDIPPRERAKARARLAIENIEGWNKLFQKFVGNKLPAPAALIDAAREIGIPEEFVQEAVDTFVVNCRFIGVLQTLSGAERLITVEHMLEGIPAGRPSQHVELQELDRSSGGLVTAETARFETICFCVTPIGDDGSEHRRHADLMLGSIIEPALEKLQLNVVRADKIEKPGTITKQIIEYLMRARLVIVDLSFHNPNVFYELAIRHAARLPVVQIIRSSDRVPFDLQTMRTIKIDTTDIYSLVPKIDVYRSEIATHARRALEDPDSADNPISTYGERLRLVEQTT